MNDITRSVIEEKIANLEEGLTNDLELLTTYDERRARQRERIILKQNAIHDLKTSLTREDT
jgi:hypothetical protein